ncbi:wings apart-like protein regulation of heterochromatin-domain-containing protein [Lipomyces orientalis]|uniref:Wings apart-like protein regulation of heterochromatin-domain-containing protein n=1 Tax=Lipomyces orientalis TaxID=1233043 RepID=A0ACC3TYE0_9ASCO
MSSSSSAFSRRTPVTTTYGRRKQAPSTPITPSAASPVRKSRHGVSSVGERAGPVPDTEADAHDSITVETPESPAGTARAGATGLTGRTARMGIWPSLATTSSIAADSGSKRKRKRRSPEDMVQTSVDEELGTDELGIFSFSDSESTTGSTSKSTASSSRNRRDQKHTSKQPATQPMAGPTSPGRSIWKEPTVSPSSPFKIVVPITQSPSRSSSVAIPRAASPSAPSTPPAPMPVPPRRPISPPSFEDLEFDDPEPALASPTPRTPSSTGSSSKWRPSPRLTSRQTEAWKMLDQVTGTVSASKTTYRTPDVSGSGGGKLFKRLAARQDSGSKSLNLSLRVKETAEIASSREDEDEQSAGDSQDAQHSESQSQRQSFASQLIRGGNITYGSQRSYLEETASATETSGKTTSISDLPDSELLRSGILGSSAATSSTSTAQSNRRPRSILRQNTSSGDEGVSGDGERTAIKSIHELRASGVNAKFIDEMEYLLDGLKPDARPSNTRLTFLELALKLTDKSFVIKFKAGGFLDRIFRSIKEMTKTGSDDITSFAMEYIVCCFLTDEGVAQSLVNEYGVVPFLLGLVGDGREITTVARPKSAGLSKVAQSLVKELRDKIVLLIPKDGDISPGTVSRRLIALTGLLELTSKYSPRHATIYAELSSNSLWKTVLGGVRDILGPADQPMRIAAQHELHLGVSILEDFAESVIAAKGLNSEYDESETCAVVERLLRHIPQMIDTPAETASLATLRLSIIITNGSSEACDVLCVDSIVEDLEKFIERVLVDRQPQDSDTQADPAAGDEDGEQDEDYSLAANVGLFCLGLLVNFCESDSARRVLTQDSHVTAFFRLFTNATSSPVRSVAHRKKSFIEDIRGYLSLVLGLLLRSSPPVRAQIGAAGVAAVGRELEIFRESTLQLQQESGMTGSRGLAEQIRSVLTDVYAG